MKYCADTWFLLSLWNQHPRAKEIFLEVKHGKGWLFMNFVTYAETLRKLFQFGVSKGDAEMFFVLLKQTEKVQFLPVEESIAKEAAHISLTYHIPLVDALVAASAHVLKCDVVLSADSDFDILVKKGYLKIKKW